MLFMVGHGAVYCTRNITPQLSRARHTDKAHTDPGRRLERVVIQSFRQDYRLLLGEENR